MLSGMQEITIFKRRFVYHSGASEKHKCRIIQKFDLSLRFRQTVGFTFKAIKNE
jgi:hypothetical protein